MTWIKHIGIPFGTRGLRRGPSTVEIYREGNFYLCLVIECSQSDMFNVCITRIILLEGELEDVAVS